MKPFYGLWNPVSGSGAPATGKNGLATGLMNAWSLGEASGTRYNSEHNLPLLENGGTIGSVVGIRTNTRAALFLPNTATWLQTATSSVLQTGEPWTVTCFIKILSSPVLDEDFHQAISLSNGTQTASLSFINSTLDASIRIQVGTAAETAEISDPVTVDLDWSTYTNTWRMYTIGHDGTNAFYSINSDARVTDGTADSLFASSSLADLVLGSSADAVNSPHMAAQYFYHWDRALSEAEVAAVYNSGQGLTRGEIT